jgi:hypothetical protein
VQLFEKPQKLVGLGRFELPTHGLGNRCSIHLSYRPEASERMKPHAVLRLAPAVQACPCPHCGRLSVTADPSAFDQRTCE